MKKLLLLLLFPLLTLSCSDSDDENVIGAGSEVTDFQTTEKIKQAVLRDKRYDLSTSFREYRRIDLEFENTSLCRETMDSIDETEYWLESAIKSNDQSNINKYTKTIASYKEYLKQMKSIYTKLCYTVVFIKMNGGSNELRKGYVNENFEFVDVSLSLNNDNWEAKIIQAIKHKEGNVKVLKPRGLRISNEFEDTDMYKRAMYYQGLQELYLEIALSQNDQHD